MTYKELFDALDPEKWTNRPMRKIFLMHNFDIEKSTREEIRQTLFAKFNQWAGQHMDKLEIISILKCYEKHDGHEVPAIEVNFLVKDK